MVLTITALATLGIVGPIGVASGASQVANGHRHHPDGASDLRRHAQLRSGRQRKAADPCITAFPNAHSTRIGGTFWWNRQESVRRVLCYHWGLEPSADFPISAGMVCGMLAEVIGHGLAKKLGIFATGACSGAELAASPREPTKYIGIACSWASTLLKSIPASLGCALAPSAGRSLGALIESKHELDVAVDVVRHDKCIKYSPSHFGSPWLAVECAHGDHGFSNLPRSPTSGDGGGSIGGAGGDGTGGGSAPGGGIGGGGKEPGVLTLNPSSIVVGQSLQMEPTGECPSGTNSVGVELVPPGGSFDPTTYLTEFFEGAGAWPQLAYEGTHYFPTSPGSYDLLAACLMSYQDTVSPLWVYRAALDITGPARTVTIQPTAVPEGGTITITPNAPCAGLTTGQPVQVFVRREGTALSQRIGTIDSSCNWESETLTLDPGVTAGRHTVEVYVGNISTGPAFWYATTEITVE